MAHARRPPRVALAAVIVTTLALAACNPDPTGGARPPAVGASVPAFTSSARAVTRAELSHSWREGCPIHWRDLRAVTVAYWGYGGQRHTGTLVVHGWVVPSVEQAFRGMYDARFQIRHVHSIDNFGGSDAAAMAANATTAFNCRRVAGTTTWSEHAYGLAIDINPVQNPYVSGSTVDPPAGRDWLDRDHQVPGMIARGDATWQAWIGAGWKWGGDWSTKKDYQHFSLSGR